MSSASSSSNPAAVILSLSVSAMKVSQDPLSANISHRCEGLEPRL